MDKYRIQFKRETEEELALVRVHLTRVDETIVRLTYEDQPFRTIDLVAKAKTQALELQTREDDLRRKIEEIDEGDYDEELKAEREQAATLMKEKSQVTRAKKKDKILSFAAGAKKSTGPRVWFVTEREMCCEYDRFVRSYNKLPDKLWEKLEHMPNNQGIVFNRISFFGKKPPRRPFDTIVMQDKQGDKFYVHYYTPTEHAIYVKEGYGRNTQEVLVSRELRRRIPTGLAPPAEPAQATPRPASRNEPARPASNRNESVRRNEPTRTASNHESARRNEPRRTPAVQRAPDNRRPAERKSRDTPVRQPRIK